MNSKIVLAVLLVFLISFTSAIVIVPPAIYFVTLSIATFIGNAIIGLLAWIALTGLINKKFFGKKLSEIFSSVFSGIKKTAIAVISMVVAVLIVNPIETFSIAVGAVASGVVCGTLLFLSNYSKFSIVPANKRKQILKSTALFSVFVLLLFGVSAFTSIETKILNPEGQGIGFYEKEVKSDILGEALNDIAGEALDRPAGAPLDSQSPTAPSARKSPGPIADDFNEKQYSADAVEKKEVVLNELWFYPTSLEECVVSIGVQSFSFKPQNNCYFLENNVPVRVACPVKISINEISQQGVVTVTASGSCSDLASITIDNGFRVEST